MRTLLDEPVVAGEDLRRVADVVFDRMTHRSEFARARAFHFKRAGVALINDPVTFWWIDKYATYDVMAAALDPRDRLPKTVLLPPQGRRFEDEYDARRWTRLGREGRAAVDVVETHFGGRWPLFLKKSIGGGGFDVFLVRERGRAVRASRGVGRAARFCCRKRSSSATRPIAVSPSVRRCCRCPSCRTSVPRNARPAAEPKATSPRASAAIRVSSPGTSAGATTASRRSSTANRSSRSISRTAARPPIS